MDFDRHNGGVGGGIPCPARTLLERRFHLPERQHRLHFVRRPRCAATSGAGIGRLPRGPPTARTSVTTGRASSCIRRARPFRLCRRHRDGRRSGLAYGQFQAGGGMSCNSEPSGMRCSNSDGHGFTLSREAYRSSDRTRGAQPVAEGICAATLKWTIVVLRDGRRSRPWRADVAQLVAHHLAKVRVAGSNPVIRSKVQWHQPQRWSGRVVRQRPAKPCTRVRFPSPPPSVSRRD